MAKRGFAREIFSIYADLRLAQEHALCNDEEVAPFGAEDRGDRRFDPLKVRMVRMGRW